MSNDPDLLDVWTTCDVCNGDGTILDVTGELDVTCAACGGDGGWEQ